MKKTLQEQKKRILEISQRINESKRGQITELLHLLDMQKIEDAIENYYNVVNDIDEVKRVVNMVLDKLDGNTSMDSNKGLIDDEDLDGPPSYQKNPHETDEYHDQFNKNMTQGFAINESNAFIGAAKKARKEGKDKFKIGGKTYKVTLKK